VQARFARCDVADSAALAAAFDAHWAAFGGMDVCVLNAGIEEKDCFLDTPDDAAWRRVVDIDLGHVIEGTRLYVRRLRAEKAPGVLLLTASSAGIFPVRGREVYAAAKGGVVHLTRSLAHLAPRHGIRVCAVCPRYTDTGMVRRMLQAHPETAQRMISVAGGTVMPISQVVDGMMECIVDSSNAGKCLHIAPGVERAYWRFAGDEAARDAQPAPPRVSATLAAWASPRGADAEVVQVWQLSPDFRAATRLVRAPLPALPLPPGKVLVRRLWAGVNASDVNFSSGRYFGGEAAAKAKLPFAAGFETVGVVAACGDAAAGWAPGMACGSFSYGGFAEYGLEDAASLLPVGDAPTAEAVALITSGLTASIALEQAAQLRRGDTVLVTAAAGGTGIFAVQLAAAAGARVVATCGGAAKAALLRSLGAHHVIDHTVESVKAVLRAEYPKGVDVVYESVGGDMFDTAVNALAPRGRLVVIGAVSQYAGGWSAPSSHPGLTEKLLWRSASCVGFFLPLHARHFRRHMARLVAMRAAGTLHVALDPRRFTGLAQAADAVEHLHSGKSLGKVLLQIPTELPRELVNIEPPLHRAAKL
jgi:NADPH:quinone reductase-like Zn-dependent oxidoreductase/short-subunit dehydrogenase